MKNFFCVAVLAIICSLTAHAAEPSPIFSRIYDCKAVVDGNRAYCDSWNCKAIVDKNRNLCE